MNADVLENINPKLYKKCVERIITSEEEDDNTTDEFDSREVFDLIRGINDPEHPLTLEELNVVEQSLVQKICIWIIGIPLYNTLQEAFSSVDNVNNEIKVLFTPTIPHCSMATLIGLSVRVRLLRALPPRFKVNVEITPGTHASEAAVNKQLADKERVAAALENKNLIRVINQCIDIKKN